MTPNHYTSYFGQVAWAPALPGPGTQWVLALHFWVAAASFGVLPATWAAVQWKRQRARHRTLGGSLCSHCGYDLRGNVSGVCPECGTIARSAPAP
jgi:hypothetical protein